MTTPTTSPGVDDEGVDYRDDYDDYDPDEDDEDVTRCPECGGDMTFVRDGVYCCTNTNDCDYCFDVADLAAYVDGEEDDESS